MADEPKPKVPEQTAPSEPVSFPHQPGLCSQEQFDEIAAELSAEKVILKKP